MAVDYNDLLYEKAQKEYDDLIAELKELPSEQVIERAYEKDFFGSPFPKGGKERRFAVFRKEIESGEIKWTKKKKNLKKYSECLTKHPRLRQKEITKLKCGRKICSLGRFPKSQLTPNGLPAHQIILHTKDNLSQVKAGISRLNARQQ